MNIFVLHEDPEIAAQLMYDQHIQSKMIVESAQMLANCFTPEQLANAPKTAAGNIRKHSYFNHPCSKWVRESISNIKWLCKHVNAMSDEKWRRFHKPHVHFSMAFINWAGARCNMTNVPHVSQTPFAIAINKDCECRKVPGFDCLDVVEKYRLYYELDKPYMTRTNPTINVSDYFA